MNIDASHMGSTHEGDRVNRRLRQDAEDISRALDDFLAERSAATKLQNDAYDQYEAEIAAIGETDDEYKQDELPYESEQLVDHNVMRQFNVVKNADQDINFDQTYSDYNQDEFENEGGNTIDLVNQIKALQKMSADKPKNYTILEDTHKKEIPNFQQKAAMREEMFNYLDSCRLEEAQLEFEYERVADVGGLIAEKAAETLYAVQKRNFEGLKDIMKEYQPVAFGTAWGNDPEYISMSESLKKMVQGSEALSVEALMGNKKKTSTKKKKMSASYSANNSSYD